MDDEEANSDEETEANSDSNSGELTSSSGGPISVGETVQGTLADDAPGDPHQDTPAVPYTLEVEERQRVQISHRADGYDTGLVLGDGNGTVLQRNGGSSSLSEDEPPGDGSMLLPLLSPDETYTVWAGADGFLDTGFEFTLSVAGPSALTADAQPVTLGDTVTTDGDAAVPDPNHPSQLSYSLKVPLRVELTEQKRVGIDAHWPVVTDDRIVPVTAAEGKPSGPHRISVDGRNIVQNSRVATSRPDEGVVQFTGEYGEMTLSPGTYMIWTEVGDTVTVREPIPVAERVEDAASISPGDTLTGELETEAPRDPVNHSYAEPYTVDGSAGQILYAELDNTEFIDPWLLLTDMDGTAITSDGSRMSAQLPEDGTYVIWVRSKIRHERAGSLAGAFDLTLLEGTIPDEARTISAGESVTAEITDDSPRDPVQNDLAIPFLVEGDGAGTAVARQDSDEFEPRLTVTDAVGQEWDLPPGLRKDGAGVANVPYGPQRFFIVWAGSATGIETGSFTLSVEQPEQ
ncbi:MULTISPECIES: hypothetical protein [Haloarcula]|uniref:hypothetical protein n=1 Tax=Haloarcula TaxID=2237 RepID=UPI0023E8D813|nr:hypothetical protein [Halomicroarcula sp. SHR3]